MLKLPVRFTFALVLVFLLPLAGTAARKAASAQTKKKTHAASTAPAAARASSKQLEQLSRDLKQKNASAAYAKLSAIANQKSSGVTGARAALALGYYDLGKSHYPQAAQWLTRAMADPLLRDYALSTARRQI